MRTKCKGDIPDIIDGYNGYFHNILWAKWYPNPIGGPMVNWFDGAILAIRKTFAAQTSITSKLPVVGGLMAPAKLDHTTIKNAKQLGDALVAILTPVSGWVTQMTGVAQEIDTIYGSCASQYTSGFLMIQSLQEDLTETLSAIKGATPPEVCEQALDWIRHFFYWQQALGMWEQLVADHCVPFGGIPPQGSDSVRVELSNPSARAMITVIQLPGDLDRTGRRFSAEQVPPPRWPPWT